VFQKIIPVACIAAFLLLAQRCTLSNNSSIKRTATEFYADDHKRIAAYTFEQFEPFMQASNDSTYVLNFWATWCAPCVAELPYFQKLQQEFNHQKVRVIYVSLDFEKQIEKKLLPFLTKNKLNGEVIVLKQKGMNDWIDKINAQWSGNLPATLIYNNSGADFYPQSFDYKALRDALKKRLP
jgi:thiol-disulfide isomerase/thioredoxin